MTNLFLFISHKPNGGQLNQLKTNNVIIVKDFSYNLKKTIILDWNVIFSIYKNLKSLVFCREYIRRTDRGTFLFFRPKI